MESYILDGFLGLILLVMAVRGVTRGIVREAMSLASFTVALFLGAYFYPVLKTRIGEAQWQGLLAFLIILCVTLLAFSLIERFVFNFLRRLNLSFIDYFFGLIVGIIEGAIVACIVVAALIVLPLPEFLHIDKAFERSVIGNFFLPYAEQFYRGWQGWLSTHVR